MADGLYLKAMRFNTATATIRSCWTLLDGMPLKLGCKPSNKVIVVEYCKYIAKYNAVVPYPSTATPTTNCNSHSKLANPNTSFNLLMWRWLMNRTQQSVVISLIKIVLHVYSIYISLQNNYDIWWNLQSAIEIILFQRALVSIHRNRCLDANTDWNGVGVGRFLADYGGIFHNFQ